MNGAVVELVDVALINCTGCGLFSRSDSIPSQLVATRCEMSNNDTGLSIYNSNDIISSRISQKFCLKNCISHHNSGSGIKLYGKVVANIHGDATAVHSNTYHGIYAQYSAKVLLHLPSHHNTCYNNTRGGRYTNDGGSITNVEDEAEDN